MNNELYLIQFFPKFILNHKVSKDMRFFYNVYGNYLDMIVRLPAVEIPHRTHNFVFLVRKNIFVGIHRCWSHKD